MFNPRDVLIRWKENHSPVWIISHRLNYSATQNEHLSQTQLAINYNLMQLWMRLTSIRCDHNDSMFRWWAVEKKCTYVEMHWTYCICNGVAVSLPLDHRYDSYAVNFHEMHLMKWSTATILHAKNPNWEREKKISTVYRIKFNDSNTPQQQLANRLNKWNLLIFECSQKAWGLSIRMMWFIVLS